MTSKNLNILLCLFLVACGGAAAAAWEAKVIHLWQDNHDGPLEVINRNTSSGPYAMTELRAGNDVGCHTDLGTTGSNYFDPGDQSIPRNTGFFVTESTCDGMLIKSNGGPLVLFAFEHGNVEIQEHDECPNTLHKGLCTDKSGVLWFVGKNGTITALANP